MTDSPSSATRRQFTKPLDAVSAKRDHTLDATRRDDKPQGVEAIEPISGIRRLNMTRDNNHEENEVASGTALPFAALSIGNSAAMTEVQVRCSKG